MLKLRPYKPCDAETILGWCKDEQSFRKWTSDRYESYPITAEDMNRKYIENNGDCPESDNFYPMTAFDESGIVGSLILRFNNKERTIVRLGFIIVDDTKRGKGYGKKMVQLATKYAFEFLGAEEVTLGVFDNNPSAQYCYKAAGFQETGEKFDIPLFGEIWTVIELEMEKHDYEALIHH